MCSSGHIYAYLALPPSPCVLWIRHRIQTSHYRKLEQLKTYTRYTVAGIPIKEIYLVCNYLSVKRDLLENQCYNNSELIVLISLMQTYNAVVILIISLLQ